MKFKPTSPKDRLVLALDVPKVDEARAIVEKTKDAVGVFKIGMQLQFADGLNYAKELADKGHKVFLDVKLLDIDNTIEKAVENLARMGVAFATIHAYPKTMRAAVQGLGKQELCLLGVTVLTSMDNADLVEAGYVGPVDSLVKSRSMDAINAGMGGIVCSPSEVSKLRKLVGSKLALVTPGIRPSGVSADDQKRIATPSQAIRMGSDYLVVGRPITKSNDMKGAALKVLEEIESSLEEYGSE